MSKLSLDHCVCYDLEASCWATKEEQGDQLQEIIEIGACFLDLTTGEITNQQSYIIRPQHSTISKYCTDLTTLTPEYIKEHGIPFIDALNKFKKDFGLASRTTGTWGNYDCRMIRVECERHGVDYPFKQTNINVKNLHALRNGLKREQGLGKAIEGYGWQFVGTAHRGIFDAQNTAKILWQLIKK